MCYTDVSVVEVRKRKSEIQDSGFVNSEKQILARTHDNYKTSMAIPMF